MYHNNSSNLVQVANAFDSAGYVPGRVLDCLLEPGKAMGLDMMENENENESSNGGEKDNNYQTPQSFLEWAVFLLGF